MKPGLRQKVIFSAAALGVLAAGIIGGRELYISRPGYGLPYYARFMPDVEDRWTALGGTWEVAQGAMRNDSNDRGAKILTGSPNWKDYTVEGDLQLLGSGSVGVLARVSEAEVGENSYKGYWAGVRTGDNSLALGAFDFAYHEAARIRMPEPVRPFRWYHVKLRVEGCRITASAWTAGTGEVRTAPLNDPDCFRSGNIGLRSNGTGGVWRNIAVLPLGSPEAPLPRPVVLPAGVPADAAQHPQEAAPSLPLQPIASLFYAAPFGSPQAAVRGSVVLTRPALYVQDSSGGIEVEGESAVPLKIGDEVEVNGQVEVGKFSPALRHARLRLLKEDVPGSPTVLTANQIVTGQYDGRFVQVEGLLRSVSTGENNTLVMDLDAGAQSFRAVLPPGRSQWHLRHLALESRLRLRGISVVDAQFNKAADPFAILVRSAEDVEIAAGPPWWRPSTLIFASLVGLGLIFAFNHLYLLARHWRLRAVADERERLAHEIHDTLAQSFAGIGFQLQAIRNSVPRGARALEAQVDLAMSMARTSHEEARRSIATLRPVSLGNTSLVPALRDCAKRMVENGNLTVETYGEDGGRAVPPRIKDAFYRIGQEAIANSIRHAHPGTIRIGVQRTRAFICLAVEDDGEGFTADGESAGFGLLGMRKRAESISATLLIKSSPGAGTRVEVKAAVGSRFLPLLWPRPRFSARNI